MAVTLPTTPGPRSISTRLISRRRDLEPATNGPTTRVLRLGSRWAIDFELPPMRYADAMEWVAALAGADGDTVIMRVPQPDFDTGAPGAPLVAGASQLGSSLNLDAFTPQHVLRAGQWLNLTVSGQSYLYQVGAEKVADGSGVMTGLAINPMIRRSPADNAAVNVTAPVIEGFLSGRETGWTVDRGMFVGLSFTVTERE